MARLKKTKVEKREVTRLRVARYRAPPLPETSFKAETKALIFTAKVTRQTTKLRR